MRKAIKYTAIVLAIIISITVIKPFKKKFDDDAHYNTLNIRLNKDLPKMVDKVTRLDKIHTSKYNNSYNYTLIDFIPDAVQAGRLKHSVETNVCREYKTNILAGITYNYNYIYSPKKIQVSYIINKNTCQNLIPKEWDINGLEKELKKSKNYSKEYSREKSIPGAI